MLDSFDDIALLRKQHAEAIKRCEFIKAKELNDQINHFTRSVKTSNTNKKHLDNTMEYIRIRECVRSSAAEEYSKAMQRIYMARIDFQKRLKELLNTQADQLSTLATNYAKAIELCTIRPVVDSNYITNEAQVRAKIHQYDIAQKLFELANSTREMTQQQRQEEVHQLYEKLQEQMKNKHTEEINQHKKKKMHALEDIKMWYDKEVAKMKKLLAATSFRL